jgi:hypothetical protein
LVGRDGKDAICPRVSEGANREVEGAGWLHKLRDVLPAAAIPPPLPPVPDIDMAPLMAGYRKAMTARRMRAICSRTGLNHQCLNRFGIGWYEERNVYAFPMVDEHRKVIGIRLRSIDGAKWAVPGSRNGLFIPFGLLSFPLWICEGPTDAAALIMLGLPAIGRPSCNGGSPMIRRMLADRHGSVVIMADRDFPGIDGARRLQGRLAPRKVFVVQPPWPHKDARAWVNAGAVLDDLLGLVDPTISAASVRGREGCGPAQTQAPPGAVGAAGSGHLKAGEGAPGCCATPCPARP